ncbi:hypothetical protein ACWCP6_29960 [Streptomyces sp. NPDC002004]
MSAHLVIGILNALAALVSGAAALVGLARPGLALTAGEQVTVGLRFFAGAYAARAVPLGAAVLVLLAAGSWNSLVPLLVVAGLAQAGDAAIGAVQRKVGMLLAAGALAVIHLLSAHWLLTH